ncbi:acid phosphatase [Nocardia camponoti]|uniref:Phosphoglycerate mutase EntD n=1 Tax=Nocardia camponoti TaxID=1616106 RepID=A0A917QF07_9NOCA|nr:acid phosphatase [Nocardia camponoti]GGK45941.1 putative phosphoglycerate mutase EntD [Nocardia camponoti]
MADADPRIVLLRHGETTWSKQRRHTGRTDLPLTEAGEAQAIGAAAVIASLDLRDPLVLTSPRTRAKHTAELAGLPHGKVDDDLAEWDYGDYEGETTAKIRDSVPGWTVWTHPTPGGETAEQVRVRADRILADVTPVLTDRDVILVGHGHFSRVLIARWLELAVIEGRRFAMHTGAVSVLGFDHGAHTLWAHNLTARTEPVEEIAL